MNHDNSSFSTGVDWEGGKGWNRLEIEESASKARRLKVYEMLGEGEEEVGGVGSTGVDWKEVRRW